MRRFLVVIGPRANPRLKFEAMAFDSFACTSQHIDLAGFGERFEVICLSSGSCRDLPLRGNVG